MNTSLCTPIAKWLSTAAALAAVVCGSLPTHAEMIYQENFDNTSASNQLLSYDNDGNALNGGGTWRARYDNEANFIGTNGVGTTSPLFGITNQTGSTGTVGRLQVDDISYGAVRHVWDAAPTFLESGAFLNVANLTTAGFATRVATSNNKLSLQIGSQWYVTDTSYGSTQETTWVNHTVNIQTDSWRTLAVVPGTGPGTGFIVGGTAQTLSAHGASGSLSSVGVFSPGGYGVFWRVDTVTVNAIPEPATFSLLGLSLLGLLEYRRRRAV